MQKEHKLKSRLWMTLQNNRRNTEMKTIFRKNKNNANPYARIDKAFLNDERLSFRAKGIMSYLLSKPDDWELNTRELQKASKEGRDAVRAAVKELIEFGYVRYKKIHVQGKFQHMYTVHEEPNEGNAEIKEPKTEKPEPEKPEPENPDTEKTDTESQCDNKQMNLSNKCSSNKYNNKIYKRQTFNKQYKKYGKGNGWNKTQKEDVLPKVFQMEVEYGPEEWEEDPEAVAIIRDRLERMNARFDESRKSGSN